MEIPIETVRYSCDLPTCNCCQKVLHFRLEDTIDLLHVGTTAVRELAMTVRVTGA